MNVSFGYHSSIRLVAKQPTTAAREWSTQWSVNSGLALTNAIEPVWIYDGRWEYEHEPIDDAANVDADDVYSAKYELELLESNG